MAEWGNTTRRSVTTCPSQNKLRRHTHKMNNIYPNLQSVPSRSNALINNRALREKLFVIPVLSSPPRVKYNKVLEAVLLIINVGGGGGIRHTLEHHQNNKRIPRIT